MDGTQGTMEYGSVVEVDIATLDGSETQTRAGLREEAVNDYRNVLLGGGELPPITLYHDRDGRLLISGGFHRIEAHKRAGRSSIKCVINPGDKWAAVQAGIRDNAAHLGERLTNADKRRGVAIVLQMKPEMSDAVIAALVRCSDRLVAKIRNESGANGAGLSRVGLDGKTYLVAKRAAAVDQVLSSGELSSPPPAGVQEAASQPTQQTPGSIEPVPNAPRPAGDQNAQPAPYTQKQDTEPDYEQHERPSIDPGDDQPPAQPQAAAGRDRVADDADHGRPAPTGLSVPQTAPQPQPVKPLPELLHGCQKHLGFLAREIDDLRRVDGVRYRRLRQHIEAIGNELTNWPSEQHVF